MAFQTAIPIGGSYVWDQAGGSVAPEIAASARVWPNLKIGKRSLSGYVNMASPKGHDQQFHEFKILLEF